MRSELNTANTVQNDDGSWTETVTSTYYPTTKAEERKEWLVVGGLSLVMVAPLLVIPLYDLYTLKREERRERKLAKKTD